MKSTERLLQRRQVRGQWLDHQDFSLGVQLDEDLEAVKQFRVQAGPSMKCTVFGPTWCWHECNVD
eukprot:1053299-Amphidinium_carterae.1